MVSLACGDALPQGGAGPSEPRGEPPTDLPTEERPQATAASPAGPRPTAARPRIRELRLDEPPHEVPAGAPHAVVWAPAEPRAVFVFLHGWNGCARVLASAGPTPCRDGATPAEGWDLLGRFQDAGRDAAFVVAQLAWRARTGDPGRFREPGYAARWLQALGLAEASPVVLLAHSAGFETALAIARRGGLDGRLRAIVLLDALYGGTEAFLAWVRASPERRLISYATRSGRPARQQRRLERLAARAGVPVEHSLAALDRASVVTLTAATGHADVPRRYLPELVRALVDADAPARGSSDETAQPVRQATTAP